MSKRKTKSSQVRTNGASDHTATDGALLEAPVAALTNGEVAARHEHNAARRAHADHTKTVLPISDVGPRLCRRCLNSCVGARRSSVARASPQVVSARHEVSVRVDLPLALPLLVSPETLEQLLRRDVIVAYEEIKLIEYAPAVSSKIRVSMLLQRALNSTNFIHRLQSYLTSDYMINNYD